ncbi:MAG: cobaltochelatase subunit CobN [Verrucomicrobia bacterium]|nr:cobaltochelatase subunit CobN [Verrucomicrobiota bacterium]
MRVPDSLPSGRNLYGFDPGALPTRAAWLTGKAIMADLLRAHEEAQGEPLQKVAYSLWAVEAMRHGGMLESQALYAMGLEPVWNERGRITGVRVIPREELGRPRVDVVLSATSLYRDQFPNLMALLAQGAAQVAELNEDDNPSFANTRRLLDDLLARGVERSEAEYLSKVRLFGSPTGVYGTGLEDATMASDTWDNDEKLARLYLRRMSYAFGPDPARWGRGEDTSELYAANLNGVQAAILARTSNLYGMLTTDDPFQYLGGLSLAIRHITGSSPELYIANQRQAGRERIESAARFLAQELQTRAFHPGWIESMQAEGYAGALNLQDMTANLWGWQVTEPTMVTAAQWQRLHSVYVNDALDLGMHDWFREHHPEALLRMVERMLEATRKEYWEPGETTLRELVQSWTELTDEFMLSAGNPAIAAFVQGTAAGFGLSGVTPLTAEAAVAASSASEAAAAEVQAPPPVVVSGRELVAVGALAPANQSKSSLWLLTLVIPVMAGGLRQILR